MVGFEKFIRLGVLASVVVSFSVADVAFEPTPSWPLCGRIMENTVDNWLPEDGCPSDRWGDANHSDAPFSSTFGPRQKASESYRYDFHRGLDIPTAYHTPIFAIAKGIVKKAGLDPSYSDALIQLRHYRPGYWGSCYNGSGCYVSNYIHLSEWVVSIGDTVEKGDLIGYTGASESGFNHLHFEIRNAPGKHDAYSTWQRDAIHPLNVLPYNDTSTSNMQVSIEDVNLTQPESPIVEVKVTLNNDDELDFAKVELKLYENDGNGTLQEITQVGNTPVGTTPESVGYMVEPSFYDIEQLNRQYSYKNSSKYPWNSFRNGGSYESPYHSVMPASYDANTHLDNATANDPKVGSFNGVLIAPAQFNTQSNDYVLSVTFTKLNGISNASNLCIKVIAYDIKGNSTAATEYNCP